MHLWIWLLGATTAFGGSVGGGLPLPTEADPHYDLEVLYTEDKYDEGLALAEARLAENPDDAELYWHVVRFMFEIAERYSRSDTTLDKEAHYRRMAEIADQGLAIAPDHAHLLFGKGIALGRLGTTRGVLSSLFLADDVEQAWLAVAASDYRYTSLGGEEQLPCDAYLTLGIFYRLVPDSWIVQALAGTRGSLDKSIENAKLADQCSPGRILIHKELGVAQLCQGTKTGDQALISAGMGALSKVTARVPDDPTDVIDIKHAAMLMNDPKLACGYSRDGQQDLDEKKLEQQSKKP